MTWIDGLVIILYFVVVLGMIAWRGLAAPAYPAMRLASMFLGGPAVGYLAWRASRGSVIATLAGALVIGPILGILMIRRVTASRGRRLGGK
jgi:hypothetical protein